MEPSCGDLVARALDERGVRVHLHTGVTSMTRDGGQVHVTTTDGADHPWKGTTDGKPIGQDAVSFKKLDANTYHVENKSKGKLLTINHIVVAADGKSRTTTTRGTNADGVKVNNVVVYDTRFAMAA